jgi:hypothetical protein
MSVPHPENPNETIELGSVERDAIEICTYKNMAWHKDKMCKNCLAISKKLYAIRMENLQSFARLVSGASSPTKRLGFFDLLMRGSGKFAEEVAESTKDEILAKLNEEFSV